MPGVRKPTGGSLRFVELGTSTMRKDGLRRARQIAGQRQMNPYVRVEPHCISCLGPRDPKAHPVCPDCTSRRKAGLR